MKSEVSRPPLTVALGLSLAVVVALGLARFAYALLLPAMKQSLGWSYTVSGSLNTANALGYLAGALLAAGLTGRLGARATLLWGMLVTALALSATPASGGTAWLLVMRGLAGAGGALAITAGGVLAAHVASTVAPDRRGALLSVYYAGGGLGILLTGLSLPPLLAAAGPGAWRAAWLALGLASLLALLATWRIVPNTSAGRRADAPAAGPRWTLWPATVTYALFALGYIAYITFSVALVRAHGFGTGEVAAFWSVLGLASMAAPLVWGRLLERQRGGGALVVLMACVALGAALPLLSGSLAVALVSALLFGGAFLSVVAATTALVRHHLPPEAWSAGVARFTVVFAAFQVLGPLLTGVLADGAGGLRLGLGVSAGLLLLGSLVALAQRAPGAGQVQGVPSRPRQRSPDAR